MAGLQNTAANLAGVAAAWFTGELVEKTKDFNAPMISIAILLVIGICSYIFLAREKFALRAA